MGRTLQYRETGSSPRREQDGLGHGDVLVGSWLREVAELVEDALLVEDAVHHHATRTRSAKLWVFSESPSVLGIYTRAQRTEIRCSNN